MTGTESRAKPTHRIALGIVCLGFSASPEHIDTNSGPPMENAAIRKTPQKPRKRPREPLTRLMKVVNTTLLDLVTIRRTIPP